MPRTRTFSGPLLPGTKSVRQVNRRNPNPKRTKFVSGIKKTKLTKMMKTVSLKTAETKRSTFSEENVSLAHNMTYYIPNLLKTSQGLLNPSGLNNADNRVGQELIARGMSFKLWISNKADRPNVMYRIIVFEYPTRYVEATSLNDGLFWQGANGQGSQMNRMIDHVAVNRVKILAERKIIPTREANYSSNNEQQREKSHLVEMYVPMNNKKILYNENEGTQPMFNDVGLALVAYDAYGTALSDILATFANNIRFYFKDP